MRADRRTIYQYAVMIEVIVGPTDMDFYGHFAEMALCVGFEVQFLNIVESVDHVIMEVECGSLQ